MSEDKPSVDTGELEEAKSGLSHVETKEQKATTKPVFKCDNCGHTEEIPESILQKMENDEDVSSDIPTHCGSQMKISVTA